MNALLRKLQSRNIIVSLVGSDLSINAPFGEMTDDLLSEIREHKAELVFTFQSLNSASSPPKAASINCQEVSEPKHQTKPVPIKDLSRDELVICIRELDSEFGRIPATIDDSWSLEKLQIWLEHKESLIQGRDAKTNRFDYEFFEYTRRIKLELESTLEAFTTADVIAIDTETTGLDPFISRIRTIQIASENLPVLVIDLFAISDPEDLDPLKKILAGDSIKVFHNAKFDLKFLKRAGLETNGQVFDTMLAAQLLTAGLDRQKYTLQKVVEDYLFETISKEEQMSNWEGRLSIEQIRYAARDAHILLPLRTALIKALVKANLIGAAKLEFDCVKAVAEMELSGIPLDLEKWRAYGQTIDAQLQSCEKTLRKYFGDGTKLSSTKQLQSALDCLGVKVTSTARDVLVEYADEHPAIATLLEYKQLSKLKSFIEALPEHINMVTQRIHANYWQLGPKSGRFACSDPNLQNVPRSAEVRGCFRPSTGNLFVISDFSQIELRVIAEISGDLRMIEAYHAGQDLHRLTASLIMGIGIDEVTKQQRQAAKAVNFGLIFGMGANVLMNYAKNSYDVKEMSIEDAEVFRDRFFQAYTGIAEWHTKMKHQKIRETRTLGGRRRVWENWPRITELYNTPVQGTAADILKNSLALLPDALQGTKSRIIGCVHDEIILETPEANAGHVAKILTAVMEEAGSYYLKQVPVVAEACVAENWADK